jgi:hypothetical protein
VLQDSSIHRCEPVLRKFATPSILVSKRIRRRDCETCGIFRLLLEESRLLKLKDVSIFRLDFIF